MLDFEESNRRSESNEAAVAEQFRKLNYLVKRLDSKSSKRRRPDFLISMSSVRPKMLCEVKTVDSAFYPRDKKKYGVENVHISTHDEKFCGTFKNVPIDLMKSDKVLSDAIDKRKSFGRGRFQLRRPAVAGRLLLRFLRRLSGLLSALF